MLHSPYTSHPTKPRVAMARTKGPGSHLKRVGTFSASLRLQNNFKI